MYSEYGSQSMMASKLIDCCEGLIHLISYVFTGLYSNILAPLARTDLSKQDMTNSQFKELFFAIRLFLIDNDVCPEYARVAIYMRAAQRCHP